MYNLCAIHRVTSYILLATYLERYGTYAGILTEERLKKVLFQISHTISDVCDDDVKLFS